MLMLMIHNDSFSESIGLKTIANNCHYSESSATTMTIPTARKISFASSCQTQTSIREMCSKRVRGGSGGGGNYSPYSLNTHNNHIVFCLHIRRALVLLYAHIFFVSPPMPVPRERARVCVFVFIAHSKHIVRITVIFKNLETDFVVSSFFLLIVCLSRGNAPSCGIFGKRSACIGSQSAARHMRTSHIWLQLRPSLRLKK